MIFCQIKNNLVLLCLVGLLTIWYSYVGEGTEDFIHLVYVHVITLCDLIHWLTLQITVQVRLHSEELENWKIKYKVRCEFIIE